jgi:ABC-type Mn2+/Zn2+ transport system ATPase subunit
VGLRVLPALGWTGPPAAVAVATGVLAALTLLVLTGGSGWWRERLRRRRPAASAVEVDAGAAPAGVAWPALRPPGGPVGLVVRGLPVVPERGAAELARLSMVVAPGTVQGLVGPNGAGKSTALRAVAAALRRGGFGGAVALEGAGPGARVVTLPQQGGGWPGCTVGETLRLAARGSGLARGAGREAAEEWSRVLGLDEVWDSLFDSLSHGVRRRVEMGRALLLRPALLLCDEPLAGLDGADRELALRCLQAAADAGVTLVVAEHDRASLARIATATTSLDRLDLGGDVAVAPA